jgi:hypothetical protein
LFRAPGDRARGKFLSRVFGIFGEDIVRLWAGSPGAPYEDLGRPTVRFEGEARSTLDFTLRNRGSGKTYVAEMKCEIEYERFRYFLLESPDQLKHHEKPAFQSFLRAAREPGAATVTVPKRGAVPIDGAILVWGAATPSGCADVREHYKFSDVLTVESMIGHLTASNDPGYVAMLRAHRQWLNEMFDGLAVKEPLPRD